MKDRRSGKRGWRRFVVALVVTGFLLAIAAAVPAAEVGKFLEIGKFQVVTGGEDKAYLVDTVTGAVWVLTYRTMATGREPIAIPYKFIRISPKNQGEFLVESAGADASMPPSGGK